MEQVESHADTGREVDLFPYVKRCALDIICGGLIYDSASLKNLKHGMKI